MERVDSVCLTRSLAFSGTQAKMDSFLIALLEDFKKNSLTQKSAGTRTPNRALYTKKVFLYASDRLHFLSILYFSLCNRWIKLFAFPQEYLHLDTWIWTASRPEIQILIPLNGRGKGRRGMVKTASFYDAQALWEMIRCSAEHAPTVPHPHGLTHGVEEFFFILWSSFHLTSLQMDLSIPTHEYWLYTAVPQQLHTLDHCTPEAPSQVWNRYP